MIYQEAKLTGTIVKTEELDHRQVMEIGGAQLRILYTKEEVDELVKDGDYSRAEADSLVEDGDLNPLLEDNSPTILRIKTTHGIFLAIAQAMDGHGNLTIVREEK